MNLPNYLKTAFAFFSLLACIFALSQLPIMSSENRANTDELIDNLSFIEHRDVVSQTTLNVLDQYGDVREQATLYFVPDVVSVRGCQSDCTIKFVLGDQHILARRDGDGFFADRPFIFPHSDNAVGRNDIRIVPTTRVTFIVIGKHSFVGMFDRSGANISIGNAKPDSILAARDIEKRVAAFGYEARTLAECPTTTEVEDDSCAVRGDMVEYCWTIKHYNCNEVEFAETRGCASVLNGSGVSCAIHG